MWILVSGAWLLGILVLWMVSRNYEKEWIKSLDSKTHPFRFLYPVSLYLLEHTRLLDAMKRMEEEKQMLGILYGEKDLKSRQRLFWCKKIAVVMLCLCCCAGFGLLSGIQQEGKKVLQQQKFIERAGAGEGEKSVSIKVDAQGMESEKLTVEIPEKLYTKEEQKEKMKEARQYVEAHFLGENKDEKTVRKPLNFMSSVPGTAIGVQWQSQNEEMVRSDGSLRNYGWKKAETCEITATLVYGEEKERMDFSLQILPAEQISQKEWKAALEEEIEQAGKTKADQKQMELPQTVLGKHVSYEEEKKQSTMLWLALGSIVAIALWIGYGQDLKKQVANHDRQMWLDYPELINKFTLLLSAGMTISGAWERIGMEYQKKRQEGGEKRYAYEQWCHTWNEMGNGVPEGIALEHFGQRTRLMPYLKFSTLLGQNLRKGSNGLVSLLEYEAMDAFETRKQMTMRLAEEAGTKLLAPMMLMLVLVMLIIMFPAMLSI